MAGDHKCPVCQSTFTRPQHVARHMRSHTGDRPYKCQHCGDAFARSDLLSRHVNKCHSAEKAAAVAAGLIPPPGSKRGKGRGSGKAACDQCIIADGSGGRGGCNSGEPCTKCVQKQIKCTYSQIPLTKSGAIAHNHTQPLPSLTLTQTSPSSSRAPRTSLESNTSSTSSVGSFPSSLDYTYRSTPVVPSSSPLPPISTSGEDAIFGNIPQGFNYPPPPQTLYPPESPTSALDLHGHGLSQASPVHASHYSMFDNVVPSPHLPQPPGSRDGLYYSNPNGRFIPRSMYTNAPSAPGSDASANSSPDLHQARLHHLHQPQPTYYIPNDGRPQTAGEGGFSNAFGLMSLDDPNVLAGLATHAPFFDGEGGKDSRFRFSVPESAPPEHTSYAALGGGDSNDIRAFWNSLIRTPSDHVVRKKNSDGYIGSSLNSTSGNEWGTIGIGESGAPDGNGHGGGGMERPWVPSRRWSQRRASLPPTKTPPALMEDSSYPYPRSYAVPSHPLHQQQVGNMNRQDELRMYEAAVLSRPAMEEFKVDSSSIGVRRSRTLGPAHGREHQPHRPGQPQLQRLVLPPGRNAPFIGPPALPRNPNLSGSDSSRTGSPVRPPSSRSQQSSPPTTSKGRHSQQTASQQQPNAPAAPTWESVNLAIPRPTPKRNASQTLEQVLQKSLRPAGASDVTGAENGRAGGYSVGTSNHGCGAHYAHSQHQLHHYSVSSPYGHHGPSSSIIPPGQGLGQYVGDTLA